jgi:hypothetical protein
MIVEAAGRGSHRDGTPGIGRVLEVLLERYGRTFADELSIDIARGRPTALFRLLCACLLFAARIRAGTALRAARILSERGWGTPRALAASGWQERVQALDDAGYARYDERTATKLGNLAELVETRWRGDLRNLRDAAGRDPARERALLKEFPGIGDVAVDIFFREVQLAWRELFPFADARSLATARRIGLPDSPVTLAALVREEDYPRLVDGLVRLGLAREEQALLEAASR